MSFAPKDEHERGIPATLAVIGRLTFPDNAYDVVHCARCRVHWEGNGGKPLMELNRVLRPDWYIVRMVKISSNGMPHQHWQRLFAGKSWLRRLIKTELVL